MNTKKDKKEIIFQKNVKTKEVITQKRDGEKIVDLSGSDLRIFYDETLTFKI